MLKRKARMGEGSSSTPRYLTHWNTSACTSKSNCPKINDSVYQLHEPSVTPPGVDIIFFHGLQLEEIPEPHLVTWTSGCDDRALWPKEWLPEDCRTARILSISYDASMTQSATKGRMDMHIVAENLLQCLLSAGVGQVPVIFVGHSFGGLVIKELCLRIHQIVHLRSHRTEDTNSSTRFLQNIRGIFYYSTPHLGSYFTDIVEKLNMKEGDLVDFVRVLSKNLARLNQDFGDLRQKYEKWHVRGIGELLPINLGGGESILIVDEASARCENVFFVHEDHFSICRPKEKTSTSYTTLVDFIREVISRIDSRREYEDIPGDEQHLPSIQVGPLSCVADGEIIRSLDVHSTVGLWGMGGIGKTTLSKAIFNHLYSLFEFTLFYESVKDIMGSEKDFEKKILNELHHKGKEIDGSKHSGFSPLNLLKGKKLLVVLDDIPEDQKISIVPKLQGICDKSSRFILTSRNRSTLRKIEDIHIIEVKPLDDQSAEALFRSYAIPKDMILSERKQKSLEGIVKYSGYLPLVLVVLGTYLKDTFCEEKSDEVWEQTFNQLVDVDDNFEEVDQIWSKLRLSYENLKNEAKQMFLDAATFFQGEFVLGVKPWKKRRWRLSEAKAAWSITYGGKEELLWRALVDRALVSNVTQDSEIKIHDLLLTLGQHLAKNTNEKKRVMIADVTRFSEILQEENIQTEELWSISLFNTTEYPCDSVQFDKMKKLQYLQLTRFVHGCLSCLLLSSVIEKMPAWHPL